jgi:hypothetical protein
MTKDGNNSVIITSFKMEQSCPYSYPPVPEGGFFIRLLEIYPAEDTAAPLAGRIIHHDLEKEGGQPYDALSYTWGKQARDYQIVIDTEDGPRKISITTDLSEALAHLRCTRSPLLIFCDQICINQAKAEDKSRFVGAMDRIYKGAAKTYAWIGESTDLSISYFDFANKVGSDTAMQEFRGKDKTILGEFKEHYSLRGNSQPFSKEFESFFNLLEKEGAAFPFSAMAHVLGLPWFRRIWIVQEACLSKQIEFVCGDGRCSFENMDNALLFLYLWIMTRSTEDLDLAKKKGDGEVMRWADMCLAKDTASWFRRIRVARCSFYTPRDETTRWELYDLVKRFNVIEERDLEQFSLEVSAETAQQRSEQQKLAPLKWEATDPRDCIHGLRGIVTAQKEILGQLQPSYATAVDVLYTRFEGLVAKRDVNILLFAQQDLGSDPTNASSTGTTDEPSSWVSRLPSWVPNWSATLRVPRCYLDIEDTIFHAGSPHRRSGIAVEACTDFKDSFLFLDAVEIDKVELVGDQSLRLHEWDDPTRIAYLSDQENKILLDYENCILLDERSEYPFFSEVDRICKTAAERNISLADFQNARCLILTGGWGLTLRNDLLHAPPTGPILENGKSLLRTIHEQRFRRAEGIKQAYDAVARNNARKEERSRASNTQTESEESFLMRLIIRFLVFIYVLIRYKLPRWKTESQRYIQSLAIGKSRLDRFHIQNDMGRGDCREEEYPYDSALKKNVGRRCFMTKQGHVGLGPGKMRKGDVVVVAVGAIAPFVLRPVSNPGDPDEVSAEQYRYVGEAYLHGFMYGEALGREYQHERRTFRVT